MSDNSRGLKRERSLRSIGGKLDAKVAVLMSCKATRLSMKLQRCQIRAPIVSKIILTNKVEFIK